MEITFLGAAGEVSGSQHLVETDRHRFLLDCGLFQGAGVETAIKNCVFHCSPGDLDGIFLSHAHIDHCGNLPGICRAGFGGPIYCTADTADAVTLMLREAARREEDETRGGPAAGEPLYTRADVRRVVRQFETLEEDEWHELSPHLSVRLRNAGHMPGASIIEIDVEDDRDRKHLVYSGDLGRRDHSRLSAPAVVDGCDVLICESTYGDRTHLASSEPESELSNHADALDLQWWIREISAGGGIGMCFLVHGERKAAESLAALIRDECDEDPVIPGFGESYEV